MSHHVRRSGQFYKDVLAFRALEFPGATIEKDADEDDVGIVDFGGEASYNGWRTFLVSPDGSVNNDGLLPGRAFSDITTAQDAIRDEGIFSYVLQVAPGVYLHEEPVIWYPYTRILGGGPGAGGGSAEQQLTRIEAAPGFVGDAVIVSSSWLNNTDYMHYSELSGMTVDANDLTGTVAARGMGEASRIAYIHAYHSSGPGFWLTGTHAVAHVENVVANSCAGPIFKFGIHPTLSGGPAAGSSGSIRILGGSGDHCGEGTGATFMDLTTTSYAIECLGMKYEARADNTDAIIRIGGTAAGHLHVGGRIEAGAGGGETGGDLFRIEGTARPAISWNALQANDFTNIVNDLVVSETLPPAGNQCPDVGAWATDGNHFLAHRAPAHRFYGNLHLYPAANSSAGVRFMAGATTPGLYAGTGSPNGVIVAAIGSIYLRLDGGANTSFYVKESGTSSPGWVAK